MTTPRETERINGELEIDYQRNTVTFHPNACASLRLPYRSRRSTWTSCGV